MPTCCAVDCRSRSHYGLRFFRIPRDVSRRRAWLQLVGRYDLLDGKSKGSTKRPERHRNPWETADLRVCALHFGSGEPTPEQPNPLQTNIDALTVHRLKKMGKSTKWKVATSAAAAATAALSTSSTGQDCSITRNDSEGGDLSPSKSSLSSPKKRVKKEALPQLKKHLLTPVNDNINMEVRSKVVIERQPRTKNWSESTTASSGSTNTAGTLSAVNEGGVMLSSAAQHNMHGVPNDLENDSSELIHDSYCSDSDDSTIYVPDAETYGEDDQDDQCLDRVSAQIDAKQRAISGSLRGYSVDLDGDNGDEMSIGDLSGVVMAGEPALITLNRDVWNSLEDMCRLLHMENRVLKKRLRAVERDMSDRDADLAQATSAATAAAMAAVTLVTVNSPTEAIQAARTAAKSAAKVSLATSSYTMKPVSADNTTNTATATHGHHHHQLHHHNNNNNNNEHITSAVSVNDNSSPMAASPNYLLRGAC